MTIELGKGHSYRSHVSGEILDAWYPIDCEPLRSCSAERIGFIVGEVVSTEIDTDQEPRDPLDAYFRLHLLSQRRYRPHEINLDGIFGILTNVAWTNCGPVLPNEVDKLRVEVSKINGSVNVVSVDKFPRMVDYVVPTGVRIGDADRIRLGAYLAEGTTVMHEGFVNFNSGTLGPSMIEGRISAGVVIGAHSDLGGSSSTMGTLSGGGTERVSVGEGCLIGANAGIGIALGDNCTVEAGLYVTAGTKMILPDGTVRTGRQLSGESNLLFRRNSLSGSVEVIPIDGAKWTGLNSILHANQ